MKKAFTLAETLIVLAIIGVLATLLLSSLHGATPDKKKAMFKKAYSVAERAIGELVNDETLYPYDDTRIGFLNTDSAVEPTSGVPYAGINKFCNLLISKVNTLGVPPDPTNGTCTFTTSDGVVWTVTTPTNANRTGTITLDVNGPEAPNSNQGDDRDIFSFEFLADGKMQVNGQKEIEFLRTHDIKKTQSNPVEVDQ